MSTSTCISNGLLVKNSANTRALALVCCFLAVGYSIYHATSGRLAYAASNSDTGIPPSAQIVYSAPSTSGKEYHLYLRTWPKGIAKELKPIPVGSYRPGNEIRSVSFSPDGKSVLFLGNRVGTDGEQTKETAYTVGLDLWVLDLEKNSVRPLTTDGNGYQWAQWSPNGAYVCAVSLGGVYPELPVDSPSDWTFDLYMFDIRSGRRRLLSNHATEPVWSSDSKHIYYEGSKNDLAAYYYVDIMGGKPRELKLRESNVHLGAWSPDGSYLAYSGFVRERSAYSIIILPHGGKEPRRYLEFEESVIGLKWSPDSRVVALVDPIVRSAGREVESRGLSLDVQTGHVNKLWRGPSDGGSILSWSRDSAWVVGIRPEKRSDNPRLEVIAASAKADNLVVLLALNESTNSVDWHEMPSK